MNERHERLRQAFLRRQTNGARRNQKEPADGGRAWALSSVATTALLGVSLLTLELTNGATTFWALDNLMGSAGVLVPFAIVLAVGLATLDTAALIRLFGPTAGKGERSFAVACIIGAWLLGATTNGVMTWWTVSATVAVHATGNVVMSQEALLNAAPTFIAVGLWIMRILLIAGYAQDRIG